MSAVNSFWYGSPLGILENLCITSFMKNGFEFHLWSYDPNVIVPQGCIVHDANQILDESLIFRMANEPAKGSIAPFSDWFRFKLLYEQGGTWVDMDMVCLKPFELYDGFVSSICGEENGKISMGIISLVKGHPMAKEIVDSYTNPCEIKPYDDQFRINTKKELSSLSLHEQREQMIWGFLGNDLLNLIFRNYSFNVLHTEEFYPIFHQDLCKIFIGDGDLSILENAKCIHMWGELVRYCGFDLNRIPPNTIFGKLLEKYSLQK